MYTILNVLLNFLRVVEILIIVRCVLSFITSLHGNQFVKYIYWITEPVLYPARYILKKLMPDGVSPIDISVLVTFLLLILLRLIIQSFI